MSNSGFSRRLLLKLLPTTSLGVFVPQLFAAKAQNAVTSETATDVSMVNSNYFLLKVVSLIPFASLEQKAAILTAKRDGPIVLTEHLGIPVQLTVKRDAEHSSDTEEFYVVETAELNGTRLHSMTVGNYSSALFVDDRVMVHVVALGNDDQNL